MMKNGEGSLGTVQPFSLRIFCGEENVAKGFAWQNVLKLSHPPENTSLHTYPKHPIPPGISRDLPGSPGISRDGSETFGGNTATLPGTSYENAAAISVALPLYVVASAT